jgi:hypothetical protein
VELDYTDKVSKLRDALQRMKDAPEGPMQRAFKERALDGMSDPKEWADGLVPVIWYGFLRFEEGWMAGFDWAST